MSELAKALAKVQGELTSIPQTKTADAGSYSYKYADLAAVVAVAYPIMSKYGLAWLAKPTVNDEGHFVLAYALLHEGGEREDGEYPLPAGGTAQQLGSAITYARRYTFCAVIGVVSEEDTDGRGGEAQTTTRPKRQQRRQPADEDELPAEWQEREDLRRRMGRLLKQLDLGTEGAMQAVSMAIGREVTDSKTLTVEELTKTNAALEKVLAEQAEGVNTETGEVKLITEKTQRRQRAQRRDLGLEGDDGGPHDQEFWGLLSDWFDHEFTSSKEQTEVEALEACRRMQIMVDAAREQEEEDRDV